MMEEMSFQVSLENCQGFSVPDGGGKFKQMAVGQFKCSRFLQIKWVHWKVCINIVSVKEIQFFTVNLNSSVNP